MVAAAPTQSSLTRVTQEGNSLSTGFENTLTNPTKALCLSNSTKPSAVLPHDGAANVISEQMCLEFIGSSGVFYNIFAANGTARTLPGRSAAEHLFALT